MLLTERHRERLRREILWATRNETFVQTQLILQSVPGIGDIWGLIIAAEIGPFDRVSPNADALEFWAGMTADLERIGWSCTQSGNITKAGSAVAALGRVPGRSHLVPLRRSCQEAIRQRPAALHRQGQGQRGHGPPAAAHAVRAWFATSNSTYRCGEPVDRTTRLNEARAGHKRRAAKKWPKKNLFGEKDGGSSAYARPGARHIESSVTATCFHSAREAKFARREQSLGLSSKHSNARPAVPVGDRDSVNSARPMRTWFYSARRTRVGNTTAMSGDCVEMNSPAPPPRAGCGGRPNYRTTAAK